MRTLTHKENGDMLDTLCEEEAQRQGWKDYTEFYLKAPFKDSFDVAEEIAKQIGMK